MNRGRWTAAAEEEEEEEVGCDVGLDEADEEDDAAAGGEGMPARFETKATGWFPRELSGSGAI